MMLSYCFIILYTSSSKTKTKMKFTILAIVLVVFSVIFFLFYVIRFCVYNDPAPFFLCLFQNLILFSELPTFLCPVFPIVVWYLHSVFYLVEFCSSCRGLPLLFSTVHINYRVLLVYGLVSVAYILMGLITILFILILFWLLSYFSFRTISSIPKF